MITRYEKTTSEILTPTSRSYFQYHLKATVNRKTANRNGINIKTVLIVDRDRETLKRVSKLINAISNHTKPQITDFTNEHVNFRDDKKKKVNKHLDVQHHK